MVECGAFEMRCAERYRGFESSSLRQPTLKLRLASQLTFLAELFYLPNELEDENLKGVGLWLLPFIFYPILGFGDASYSPVIQVNKA